MQYENVVLTVFVIINNVYVFPPFLLILCFCVSSLSLIRCPTDIICLILFLLFVAGMIGIGGYGKILCLIYDTTHCPLLPLSPPVALAVGKPQRLLHPVDSKGRLCGLDSGVE